jgi:NADPH-dependent F420 reductase
MARSIAIIGGTGNQGFGLALRFAKAGEHVIIGSRDINKAKEAVKRIKEKIKNSNVEAETYEDSVKKAEIVILTVPLNAIVETLERIKNYLKKDSILVDVTNPLASSIGGDWRKNLYLWEGSAAELCASC